MAWCEVGTSYSWSWACKIWFETSLEWCSVTKHSETSQFRSTFLKVICGNLHAKGGVGGTILETKTEFGRKIIGRTFRNKF